MNVSSLIGLVLFALLLAAGQILFKATAVSLAPAEGAAIVVKILRSPYAWLAVALYGSATILWIVLLRTVPLAVAYPFVALGFVVVPLAAALFFGEPITARYALGVILILAGIYFIQSAAPG